MADTAPSDLTTLTVDLLSAYLSSSHIESGELAGLIRTTHDALAGLGAPDPVVAPTYEPAVGIRKSLSSPDHIVSLIDGKPYKTLKRHLGVHGLTPDDYRARYNLPRDYPMVAPSYSDKRRAVAEKLGLGRKVRNAPTETIAVQSAVADAAATPKKAAVRTAKIAPAKAEMASKAEAPLKAKPATAKAARAPKPAPAADAAPTADAPKARAKRAPLKLNLSALKAGAEPVSN